MSVQDLTAGRPRLIVRDYIDPNTLKTIHKSEYVREQPLIETLTDTLEGGSRNGSASTSTAGSRMPISGNALDILTHIEQTVKGYGPTDNLKKQLNRMGKSMRKKTAPTPNWQPLTKPHAGANSSEPLPLITTTSPVAAPPATKTI